MVSIDACFAELLADRRNEMVRPTAGISLAQVRAAAAAFLRAAKGPTVASVRPASIVRPGGADLPLRIYRPTDKDDLPVVIFCHGGGFVFGSLDTHDALCRALAVHSNCVIIAVEYRLAPEYPFPAATDDCWVVIPWLTKQASTLGLRASAMALAGDSAGANIAIATALTARDRGINLAQVALLYPLIDPSCGSPSMAEFGKGYLLTREAIQWFWECYLPMSSREDPRARVLAADLRDFPPTTIVTAEFDPLRDEGEAFAARLRTALVPVELHRFAGMIHGFAGLPQLTPQADHAAALLGRALARSFSQ